MINFRFHLVSLIAVFLALALGVVVGSTVIDRAIVDGLEAQINRVERNANTQRRENAELRQQIEQLGVLRDQASPFAIDSRLAQIPVVVVAVRGVDEGDTRSVIQALRSSGAIAPGILWLEPSWALVRHDDLQSMRELLGRPDAGADTLRSTGLQLVAQRLAVGSAQSVSTLEEEAAPTTTTTSATGESNARSVTSAVSTTSTTAAPAAGAADLLGALVDRGFVSIDRAGASAFDSETYPGPAARVVVVGGSDAKVSAQTLFMPLVKDLADVEIPTLVAELPASGDDQAEIAGLVRRDDKLARQVSTVDDADTVGGRLAVVLALEELGRGTVGHYGLGPGASRQLPEPPQPPEG